jgi:hypothetical protein
MKGNFLFKHVSQLFFSITLGVCFLSNSVVAHAGGLPLTNEPAIIPTWLFVLTGGVIIGISFLFVSLVTQRQLIDKINGYHLSLPLPRLPRLNTPILTLVSVFLLLYTILLGFIGPQNPTSNFAILFVWVVWWAGYTMTVYLFGNTWEQLNPWKSLSTILPTLNLSYPSKLGSWPASVGLLFFILIEVGSDITYSPYLLSCVLLFYTVLTLLGSFIYGSDTWFKNADPISKFFRYYGAVSLLTYSNNSINIHLPGTKIMKKTNDAGPPAGHQVLFIITILFITTYDGLISTQFWNSKIIFPLLSFGIPILIIHFIFLLFGHGLFYAIYHYAILIMHRLSSTYISIQSLNMQFAVSLIPIAAGYHLAHFTGYLLTFFPAFFSTILHPLQPPMFYPNHLPFWISIFTLIFILLGHICSVWISHCISFKLFSGRLQPLRSQYPLIFVMVLYTMFSLWIVTSPSV